jgi:hypothetical protein
MRSSKQRSRSKSNRPKTLGNIVNRVFDSSGPEGKVRGTPQQIIDKYQVLARDAQLSGDRVAAENFLQHAEHYTRMLSEAQRELAREQESRRDQQFPPNGQNRRIDARDFGERPAGGREDAEFAGEQQADRDGGNRRDGQEDRRRNGRERDDRGRETSRPAATETPLAAVDPSDESESMLVETPESRTTRRDTASSADAHEAADPFAPDAPKSSDAPESDEGGGGDESGDGRGEAKRPRQPRARATGRRGPRKPKNDDDDPGSDSGSAAAAE